MTSFITSVQKKQQEDQQNKIFEVELYGTSLSGVEIPVVTITDFKCTTRKTTIVINGRVHPGETNASWALHGFMHFLLSKAETAK